VLALYFFCLVLGGGFLLVSVLGGDGGDLEVDADLDLDSGDATHDSAASRIFSLRTLVYGLFGFGATGAALTALGASTLSAFVFALAGGALAGVVVGTLFHYLGATESGAAPLDQALIGLTGRVTLPLTTDSPGAIAVERGARRTTLRALPHASAGGDPASWRRVVVVDVEGSVVRVAPLEGDDADLLPAPGDEPD
jgi:hypothetical protein